jgi:phosphate transport system substrate-binding protein
MTRLTRGGILLSLGLSLSWGGESLWARPVQIVGSSALAPFIVAVAERFGYEYPYGTPVVESTGTGGGIKYFCGGTHERYPPLVSASRPMSQGERAYCKRHGVEEIVEIALGLDALVVVRAKEGLFFPLSMAQLKAATQKVPPLPLRWQEIDRSFPDDPIKIFAPPETSGTRETFDELVFGKKGQARTDGALRSVADQESVIARKLTQTPDAIGVLSYAFLIKNHETLRAFALSGVTPDRETILNRKYPLVRQVYLYAKKSTLKKREDVHAFVAYITSGCVQGFLSRYGLLPLSAKDQRARHDTLKNYPLDGVQKGQGGYAPCGR